jgi:hypothetical protein
MQVVGAMHKGLHFVDGAISGAIHKSLDWISHAKKEVPATLAHSNTSSFLSSPSIVLGLTFALLHFTWRVVQSQGRKKKRNRKRAQQQ